MSDNSFFEHTDYDNLMNANRTEPGQDSAVETGAENNSTAENNRASENGTGNTAGEPIAQGGAYGWQSVVPPKTEEKTEEKAKETAQVYGDEPAYSRTAGNGYSETSAGAGYTHTDAYAEASAKELSRAAKEARRNEKREKRLAKRQGRGVRGVIGRIAATLMCGILFGCATAGAFIGVMNLTGYADRIENAIEAADRVEEYQKNQENNIQTGTAINTTPTDSDTDVQAVYNKAIPSVVAITNTAVYNYNYGFFSYEDEVQGSGSGIIIGKNATELLIVTNYHVIEGASSLAVTFVDDQTVEAYVKGTAEENDLAVVAVMLEDMMADTKAKISIATLGSEDEVQVGQKVVAIGNALGYGQVLTVGYVSAVNRDVVIENKTMTLIQTDAAINPGNSGGALLNMNGEVIGINSAKYSDTDVEGMGFAIPISLVREIIDDLMTRETMIKVSEEEMGYLGVSVVNSSSTNAYGMPTGAYVYSIAENTPAANSDLREGDIITKLNDTLIDSKEDLTNNLAYYKGGTTVTLTVQRRGAQGRYEEVQVEITLGFRKDYVQE